MRILLVEDDHEGVAIFSGLLLGRVVDPVLHTAYSAHDACTLLEKFEFDVLVIDGMLAAGLNGPSVMRATDHLNARRCIWTSLDEEDARDMFDVPDEFPVFEKGTQDAAMIDWLLNDGSND